MRTFPRMTREVLSRLPQEWWRCQRGEISSGRLSQGQVHAIVQLLVEVVVEEAAQGRRPRIPGLGVFRAVKHAPKRVTTHGREHHVPERTLLKFRASGSAHARLGGAR